MNDANDYYDDDDNGGGGGDYYEEKEHVSSPVSSSKSRRVSFGEGTKVASVLPKAKTPKKVSTKQSASFNTPTVITKTLSNYPNTMPYV